MDDDTGEEKKRLINRMRWKGFGPISVSYAEKTVSLGSAACPARRTDRLPQVPDKPSATVEEQRGQADKKILGRLEEVHPQPVPLFIQATDVLTALSRASYLDPSRYLQPIPTAASARHHQVCHLTQRSILSC